MKPNRSLYFLVLLFVSVWVLSHSILFAAQDKNPRKVLVLTSYKPTSPVGHMWEQGIRSGFEAEPGGNIEIFIEHLDLNYANDERYERMLKGLLDYKYSRSMPDMIISIYKGALLFLYKYGPELFPGVPIVFAGIEKQFLERQSPPPNSTGILNANSYRETLELAIDLHPDSRHCAIISGAGIVGSSWSANAKESYRPYENRIDFIDLSGLPIQTILQRVADLPPRTVVIYLPILKDGAGSDFAAPDALSQISHVTNSPIYSLWKLMLGHGIVGGYLSVAESRGKMAADVVLRIFNGEKPSDIPISAEGGSLYMFDWRELKRWGIAEDKLPPGAVVQFTESSFWAQYKGQIIAIAALFLFQLFVILGFFINYRDRKSAEKENKERLEFEKLSTDISSQFANVGFDKADALITHALARIGNFMEVERSFLFRFNWERTEFRISHLWEQENIEKDTVIRGVIVKELFPWLAENMLTGTDVVVFDVQEMPAPEANAEIEYCKQMGIQSFLLLPITVANAPLCAIGLDSINSKRKWTQSTIDRLRLLGEVFTNTIVHRHANEKLHASERELRIVADFTYDWEYWQNPDGTLKYVSPSCERVSGYSQQEFMAKPSLFTDIIVSETKKIWEGHQCKTQKGMKAEGIQFSIKRKDGSIRWIEHVCQPIFDSQRNFQGIRASNRDITIRKQYKMETDRLRVDLAHVERVVTIGALTSTLAHEINQPLAAMRSYAQAALRFLDADQPDYDNVRKGLQGIIADNKRASAVINRLRGLVEKKGFYKETLDVNTLVKSVTDLIRSEIVLRKAVVAFNLQSDVPAVRGDTVQIQQVIINLLTNALDAMDDLPTEARHITITTTEEAGNIIVSVSDSGEGIDPKNIESVFEPFHTTKTKGLGLGLAICRSIIKAHSGQLTVKNNPDGGAILSFTLPCKDK